MSDTILRVPLTGLSTAVALTVNGPENSHATTGAVLVTADPTIGAGQHIEVLGDSAYASGDMLHALNQNCGHALARFRPFQPTPRTSTTSTTTSPPSIVSVDRGWQWSFDPLVYFHSRCEPTDLGPIACPTAFVVGERGMCTPEVVASIRTRTRADGPCVALADAGHHLPLEQPLALLAAMNTLLAMW